jgi:tRNA dimethylallyltransferase
VILSADSRQFYRELSIGTAKPTIEEQQGIQHYFIDSHSITDEVTASTYAKEALSILDVEFKNHDTIIMVGGSGMFIDAVCNGLDDIPASIELRNELTEFVKQNGLDILLAELNEKDPEFYTIVDKQNPVRVIRAIEAIRLSNMTFSEMRKNQKIIRPFETIRVIIDHDRQKLYERINLRVDIMIENGLTSEVKSLMPHKNLSSLKTVGYSELFRFLEDEIDLQEAIELIKQNSRRYAKRQLTWFRKHEDATWIQFTTVDQMTNQIIKKITTS